jgi:hypothetical protein
LSPRLVRLLVPLLLLSCGPQGTLGGSVSDIFPLDVESEQVLRNSNAFQVSYYASDGTNEDIVIRLTLDLTGIKFVQGVDVPLGGTVTPDGGLRATVIHLTAGEAELVFPPVLQGDLNLTSGGNAGEYTTGNFSLSFINTTDVGGGRTVNGTFGATAQDAGYGPGL